MHALTILALLVSATQCGARVASVLLPPREPHNMCMLYERPPDTPYEEGVYRINTRAWDGYMFYGFFSVGTGSRSDPSDLYALHLNMMTSHTWLVSPKAKFKHQLAAFRRQAVTDWTLCSSEETGMRFANEFASGDLYRSILTILPEIRLTLTNFTYGVATELMKRSTYHFMPADGTLGLGRQNVTTSFFYQAKAKLKAPVVSFWLERQVERFRSQKAVITFGATDDKLCGSNWTWLNVVPCPCDGWWLPVDSVVVGHGHVDSWSSRTAATEVFVLFDMDLSLSAPEAEMDYLVSLIGDVTKGDAGNESYLVPCEKRETGPTIFFVVGEHVIALRPEDYVIGSSHHPNGTCSTAFSIARTWTIGSHLLNSHCAALDFGGDRVGFTNVERRRIVRTPLVDFGLFCLCVLGIFALILVCPEEPPPVSVST